MIMKYIFSYLFLFNVALYGVDGRVKQMPSSPDPFQRKATAKIGDNPFPTNPMSDRAKGFVDQGRVKSAVTNYGSFINWIIIHRAYGETILICRQCLLLGRYQAIRALLIFCGKISKL